MEVKVIKREQRPGFQDSYDFDEHPAHVMDEGQLKSPVRSMSNGLKMTARKLGKTRVVEIVGPAGAGKTTLYRTLDCYTDFIRLENFPDVRRLADAPFFVSNGLKLIPSLLRLHRFNGRQLTRREFAWMSILNGWSDLLRKESNADTRVLTLDQGPVYLLAEMRLFGPEYLKQTTAERLWHNLYERWGAALDMVVWLDAANEVLLKRIQNRRQEHVVKNQPPAIVYEFLNRYRTEYDFLLSRLTAQKAGLKVLRIDTGQRRPQDIVNQFISELSC